MKVKPMSAKRSFKLRPLVSVIKLIIPITIPLKVFTRALKIPGLIVPTVLSVMACIARSALFILSLIV